MHVTRDTVKPSVSDQPKMQSSGGCVQEMVAYERSEHNSESYQPVVVLMCKAPISAKQFIIEKFWCSF